MLSRIDWAFLRLNRQAWVAATAVVVIVYLINCFTPFRLTNDTVRYFAMMEDRLGTWPETFGKPRDFLPVGYVYFLEILARLHLLSPFSIAFCQLLYLAGSMCFIRKLFGATINTWFFAFLVLLNWTTIKLVITPLSELQFLFFSSAALYSYQCFLHNKRLVPLALTILLSLVAFATRTAGIVLIAALLLSFVLSHRRVIGGWLRQRPLVSVMALLVMFAGITALVTQPKFITYFGFFWRPLSQHGVFVNNLRLHFMDFAELFINTPYSKVAMLSASPVAAIVYLSIGILFLGLLTWCLVKHRTRIPLSVSVYLVLYLLLIFNWPFFEARFFFPILPLALAVFLLHLQQVANKQRLLAAAFLTCYVIVGVFVLGYYSRMSMNKDFMMKRHDTGLWETEYGYLFSGKPVSDSTTINQKALYILRKYN